MVTGLMQWSGGHPQTTAMVGYLHDAGVRCGVFSSTVLSWYDQFRQARDTDLFMHPDDFERFLKLVPAAMVAREVCINMRNDMIGCDIQFWAHEASVMLDGRMLQVIRPLTPVRVGLRTYDLHMSDFAVTRIVAHEVGHANVYGAHLFDTIAVKIIMARSEQQGKHDIKDAFELAKHLDFADPYILARSAELGIKKSQLAFLTQPIMPAA